MTYLAAWIAEKRAASAGATEGPWEALDDGWTFIVGQVDGESLAGDMRKEDARHIAAFDPATTRRLLDAAEALDMLRRESKAYGGTSPAAEAAADAALDALADLADGGGWRAMDIAPRDGTRVLTYSPGAVALGFRAIRVNWFEDGLWQHTNAQHWPPTHWRPLPAPPKENDDGR